MTDAHTEKLGSQVSEGRLQSSQERELYWDSLHILLLFIFGPEEGLAIFMELKH